jgi:outer membrane lipoprotein-sorting protein
MDLEKHGYNDVKCEIRSRKRAYLDSRRDLEVVEVRVNEELPDSLFEMEFKEGVKVNDEWVKGDE